MIAPGALVDVRRLTPAGSRSCPAGIADRPGCDQQRAGSLLAGPTARSAQRVCGRPRCAAETAWAAVRRWRTGGRCRESHPAVPQLRHRPAAGMAIRWPRATHRLGSLPAIGAKRGEEGSLTFQEEHGNILARWGTARKRDQQRAHQTAARGAQKVRPSTISRLA
jgi:hypothetical protein